MIDHDNRAGLGHYSRSHWLAGFEDQLIDTLVERFAQAPSPLAHVITARMGGAVTRVPADATAFRHRAAANLLWIIGYWPRTRTMTRRHTGRGSTACSTAPLPFGTGGVYVNGLDREGPERIRAAYRRGHVRAARCAQAAVGHAENVLRLNHNIPPRG